MYLVKKTQIRIVYLCNWQTAYVYFFIGISSVEATNKTIFCQFDTRIKPILQFVTQFADRNLRHHAMCVYTIAVNNQIAFHIHVNLITLSSNISAEC